VINFIQMPADILVVTASTELGDTVRRSLEETDLYRIHVVNNKSSAIVRADDVGVPLAMLDFSLSESWVREIGTALRTIRPSINIIILCDDNMTPPAFDELRPWILVRKPFKMSNFMTAISKPQTTPVPQMPTNNNALAWLSDATKAAQHLTRLTLESSAQAALITRKNDLWAYAGSLSQQAAKEVAQTVSRNWDGQKGSDLLRFIRLESTKAEHMLYATRLATDTVLSLVFDAETPFSTIRSQAGQLVTNLGNENAEPQKPVNFAPPMNQPADLPTNMMDEDDFLDIPPITDILTNIPAPNPEPTTTRTFGMPPVKREKFDPNQTRIGTSQSNARVFSREASPSVRVNNNFPVNNQNQVSESTAQARSLFDQVEVTAPSRPMEQPEQRPVEQRPERPETPVARPVAGDPDVTRESPTTEASRKLVIEPISAGLYHLTYACLLVPRFSAHFLTGDVSDKIGMWLPNICIAFGWRLEYLSVRPEYLQWVVNVQTNTSPGYLMRIMRQQTSEKIFTEFTRLKKENPSGDFWAPGYLIMGGSQPHPQQLVRDYIHQTRQRQGQEVPSEPRGRN
jgi:REP element-mobilizing transposase RayT